MAPEPTIDPASPDPKRAPRGFLLGALFGLLIAPPMFTGIGLALAAAEMIETTAAGTLMGISATFVAFPAAISAGGIARIVIREIVADRAMGSVLARSAMRMAIAGVGLSIIFAIAAGPTEHTERWPWIAAAGLIAGALFGAVLAAIAAIPTRSWLRENATES